MTSNSKQYLFRYTEFSELGAIPMCLDIEARDLDEAYRYWNALKTTQEHLHFVEEQWLDSTKTDGFFMRVRLF